MLGEGEATGGVFRRDQAIPVSLSVPAFVSQHCVALLCPGASLSVRLLALARSLSEVAAHAPPPTAPCLPSVIYLLLLPWP